LPDEPAKRADESISAQLGTPLFRRINTLTYQKRDRKLMLLTASAGLLAALISICGAYPLGRHGLHFFPGAAFGAIISGCFALRRYLRDVWKAIAITATSTFAYYASMQTAAGVELYSPFALREREDATVSAAALFAGGLVGAFLVLCAVSLLLDSETAWRHRVLKSVYWSPVGGVLGIVGWVGPSLGMALWSVFHSMGLTVPGETFQNALYGQTSHVYSLWVVWQIGLGFVLGLVLRGPAKVPSELPASSTIPSIRHYMDD
jgi:hypothetical protein